MSSLYTPVNKVRSNMHLAIDKCTSSTFKFDPILRQTRRHIDIKRRIYCSMRQSTSKRIDTSTYVFVM